MAKTIADLKRDVPVYDEVDVLVCGGGPAGFCAAIAAARAGASVLLIEQTNCLGGIATAGGHNHLCLYTAWGDRRPRRRRRAVRDGRARGEGRVWRSIGGATSISSSRD